MTELASDLTKDVFTDGVVGAFGWERQEVLPVQSRNNFGEVTTCNDLSFSRRWNGLQSSTYRTRFQFQDYY